MGGKFPARSDIRDMADRFHRRSIRLKGYDYTQAGAYFVTACTHERAHLFGDVDNGMMAPNAMGMVAQRCWDAIPEHMPMVALDEFVVMPNHIHGIIVITDPASSVGNGQRSPATTTTNCHHGPKFIGPHHANVQGRGFAAGREGWFGRAWHTDLATRVY